MNIETVKVENKNYYIVNELEANNNLYLYLVNENDNSDIIIRKKVIINDEEFLTGLDDEEEFNMVMKLYLERFSN
ncbi:MAG: DUF1292 domain-containing protein [Bacilli bacterium]|nr:DUF1292 domain-containing protein [Bacilli bacterium]